LSKSRTKKQSQIAEFIFVILNLSADLPAVGGQAGLIQDPDSEINSE
jgi:hypothetical protein